MNLFEKNGPAEVVHRRRGSTVLLTNCTSLRKRHQLVEVSRHCCHNGHELAMLLAASSRTPIIILVYFHSPKNHPSYFFCCRVGGLTVGPGPSVYPQHYHGSFPSFASFLQLPFLCQTSRPTVLAHTDLRRSFDRDSPWPTWSPAARDRPRCVARWHSRRDPSEPRRTRTRAHDGG
jgi:hypothetical protein